MGLIKLDLRVTTDHSPRLVGELILEWINPDARFGYSTSEVRKDLNSRKVVPRKSLVDVFIGEYNDDHAGQFMSQYANLQDYNRLAENIHSCIIWDQNLTIQATYMWDGDCALLIESNGWALSNWDVKNDHDWGWDKVL